MAPDSDTLIPKIELILTSYFIFNEIGVPRGGSKGSPCALWCHVLGVVWAVGAMPGLRVMVRIPARLCNDNNSLSLESLAFIITGAKHTP